MHPLYGLVFLHKGALPPAGKYKMSVHFGSNTNIVYQSSSIWFGVRRNNVSQQESNYYVDGYSSGDFRLSQIYPLVLLQASLIYLIFGL